MFVGTPVKNLLKKEIRGSTKMTVVMLAIELSLNIKYISLYVNEINCNYNGLKT